MIRDNECTLLGHVGAEPEITNTQYGKSIAKFPLATTENWKDKDGERQSKTEWHRIVAFGKEVETIQKYVKKGDRLIVGGKITYGSYTDKDGIKRYTTDIALNGLKMLTTKKEREEGSHAPPVSEKSNNTQPTSEENKQKHYDNQAKKAANQRLDDDLPF